MSSAPPLSFPVPGLNRRSTQLFSPLMHNKPRCLVLRCLVLRCLVLRCRVLRCRVLRCRVLRCRVLRCLVLRCRVLRCLLLRCLLLRCLLLRCLLLPATPMPADPIAINVRGGYPDSGIGVGSPVNYYVSLDPAPVAKIDPDTGMSTSSVTVMIAAVPATSAVITDSGDNTITDIMFSATDNMEKLVTLTTD